MRHRGLWFVCVVGMLWAAPAWSQDVGGEGSGAEVKSDKDREIERLNAELAEVKAAREREAAQQSKQAALGEVKSDLFKGDFAGVIRRCNGPKLKGHKDCHRFRGLAYSKLGDKKAACREYAAYLVTKPANAEAVEREMVELSCEAEPKQ
jgi:hypothetical protein